MPSYSNYFQIIYPKQMVAVDPQWVQITWGDLVFKRCHHILLITLSLPSSPPLHLPRSAVIAHPSPLFPYLTPSPLSNSLTPLLVAARRTRVSEILLLLLFVSERLVKASALWKDLDAATKKRTMTSMPPARRSGW